MKEKMWTTEMLLDCIFCSGIKKLVPQKVLVRKSIFSKPKPEMKLLTSNKTLEDILAAL